MDETLDAALRRLFTGASGAAPRSDTPASILANSGANDTATTASAALIREAMQHYERARAAQRIEDWAAYGVEMRQLGEVLRRLSASRVPR
jgi:uncharacterized membrane protein (UPF0182 family)